MTPKPMQVRNPCPKNGKADAAPCLSQLSVRNALELKVPVDELEGMLVDKMDSEEPQFYVHLFSCLGDLLETGKHERPGGAFVRTPDKTAMVAVKAAWKRFFQDQSQAIRNGKRCDRHSPGFCRLTNPDPDEDR